MRRTTATEARCLVDESATRAERRLGRIEGHFIVTTHAGQWQAEWFGNRRDRAEAERVLLVVLAKAGLEGRSIPGLGVWVARDEVRPVNDHEGALHNGEASPETMAECGAAAE